MVIYAIPGESTENISYAEVFVLPEGCVVMRGPRPDPTYYASRAGEWLPGPSPADKAVHVMTAEAEYRSRFSYASNMIGALSDEILSIEDAGDPVPDALRVTLKSWRTYRIALTKVDISTAPDITWPISPEQREG